MSNVKGNLLLGLTALAAFACAQGGFAQGNQERNRQVPKKERPAPKQQVQKAPSPPKQQVQKAPVQRRPAQPVFRPQRVQAPERWKQIPGRIAVPQPSSPQRVKNRPPITQQQREQDRRRVDALKSPPRQIQRITPPRVASGQALPPKPNTFNFAGRNWDFSDRRFRQAPIGIHHPELRERWRFHNRVPIFDGFRIGFVQYNPSFRDSSFFFAWYGFWPYGSNVYSPWYCYPQLPPYIALSIVYVVTPPIYSDDYDTYRWYPRDEQRSYGPLDYAIQDIVTAFEENDERAISRLIPRDGDVDIYLEGDYQYSIRGGDFAEMMHDAVSDVRTTGYHIDTVRRHRDGTVLVTAQHNTIDPWGNRETVYHRFRLAAEDGYWVIREFGTSQNPF